MALRIAVAAATLACACALEAVAAAPAEATSAWPTHGQAAYVLGSGPIHVGPHQAKRPIASVAKVMTAYLVLRSHRIAAGKNGFTMTVRRRDVADLHRRNNRGESTVPVRTGEHLTERKALAALLLPSANNIAIMLARKVSGTVRRFVAAMNRTARSLGLRNTTYTDPSGFDAGTRSTAMDQTRFALVAMRQPFLARMVSRTGSRIPVAGMVHNTDKLLGRDGFVGIKTGSMRASGGCFMFRSYRIVRGRRVAMTGVVLGQRYAGGSRAAQQAAKRLVDRVAPRAARL